MVDILKKKKKKSRKNKQNKGGTKKTKTPLLDITNKIVEKPSVIDDESNPHDWSAFADEWEQLKHKEKSSMWKEMSSNNRKRMMTALRKKSVGKSSTKKLINTTRYIHKKTKKSRSNDYVDRIKKKLSLDNTHIYIYVLPYEKINDDDGYIAEKYAIDQMNVKKNKNPLVDAVDEQGILLEMKRAKIKGKKRKPILHQIRSVYTSPGQWNKLVKNPEGGYYCIIFESIYSKIKEIKKSIKTYDKKNTWKVINKHIDPDKEIKDADEKVVLVVCIPAVSSSD
jgi:hypothetical protein